MRTIICKKCGAEIDAALGECPNCGAVYYILPDEDKTLEWAMSSETDIDETRVIGNSETSESRVGTAHGTRDILNADNDELFNTRVWKLSEDQDATKAVHTQSAEKTALPIPPVRRPIQQQRPVHQNTKADTSRGLGGNNQSPKNEKDIRKEQLVVAAVALLAVLTLVLSFMGGLFDFTGNNDDSDKMPNVVGSIEETATTVLNGMGLEVITMKEENEAIAGTVIRQSIKEGNKIKEGDSVTLVISSGQSTETTQNTVYVDVPSLLGKTYDEAKQVLTEKGLVITSAADAYSEEEIGTIISQSPMKGAKLQEGDLVTVTVSKGSETTEYTISVTAGKGGSISPKGAVSVEDGEDQTFTITADDGYEISEVKVDGTDIGAATSYTFTKVSEDHTLYVVFRQQTATPTPTPSATTPSSGTDINIG